jgi:tRNA U34 5-methylaminomethyl-2-thiouridine-forming methyltransferase MnmC
MADINIITTSDGSHSLFDTHLNETYHSIHGAIQESRHVFIRQGLENWLERNAKTQFRILEVGFGTGLNALLTLLFSLQHTLKIYYESWELSPLETAIIQQLNYGDMLECKDWYQKVSEAEWNKPVSVTADFTLQKHRGDIIHEAISSSEKFDIVYYDAFAPSKQPEMWTPEVLRKTTDALRPGGIWITYCAKGQVKRDLASFGLKIETLPGPPGKKEMIRAWSNSSIF